MIGILGQLSPANADLWGNKALALDALLRQGADVPPAVVLGTPFFDAWLERSGLAGSLRRWLDDLAFNWRESFAQLSEIHSVIHAMRLPGDLLRQLEAFLGHMPGPWIVRSSATCEDIPGRSAAGVFTSVRDVGKGSLVAALLACWSSIYTARTLVYLGNRAALINQLRMAVIIQHQVSPRAAGVLFTIDPVAPGAGALIEVAPDTEVITSGGPASRYHVRGGEIRRDPGGEAILSNDEALALVRLGAGIQQGRPLDLEWALQGDRFHVLQVRPATAVSDGGPDGRRDLLDTDGLTVLPVEHPRALAGMLDYADCQQLQERFSLKKIPLRILGQAHSIRQPVWLWVRVTTDRGLRELQDCLPQLVPSGLVAVSFNSYARGEPLRCGELPQVLARLGIGGRRPATILLRELIPADFSAISSVMPGGRILIESVQGLMSGIREGVSPPSRFICDAAGRILDGRHVPQEKLTVFDHARCRFIRTANVSEDRPPEPALAMIAKHTVGLSGLLGEIRVEWLVWQGREYLTDLTYESRPLTVSQGSGTVISVGTATGRVVRVDDVCELEKLGSASVFDAHSIPDTGSLPPHVACWLNGYLGEHRQDAIIVARRPCLGLSIFVRAAQGFIFEEGSVLCHLAIQIREAGKPAIIHPGALALRSGDLALITAGSAGQAMLQVISGGTASEVTARQA